MTYGLAGTIIHANGHVYRTLGAGGERRSRPSLSITYDRGEQYAGSKLTGGVLDPASGLRRARVYVGATGSTNRRLVCTSYEWMVVRGSRFPEVKHYIFKSTARELAMGRRLRHLSQIDVPTAEVLMRAALLRDPYHRAVHMTARYVVMAVGAEASHKWLFDAVCRARARHAGAVRYVNTSDRFDPATGRTLRPDELTKTIPFTFTEQGDVQI